MAFSKQAKRFIRVVKDTLLLVQEAGMLLRYDPDDL